MFDLCGRGDEEFYLLFVVDVVFSVLFFVDLDLFVAHFLLA